MRGILILSILLALGTAETAVCGLTVDWSGPQTIDLFYLTDYGLDVDGNGTVDFQYGGLSGRLDILPNDPLRENQFVVDRWELGLSGLSVLPPGTLIGPDLDSHPDFGWSDEDSPYLIMGTSTAGTGGPWVSVDNGLLGFHFVAEDGIHYGWAKMSYVNDYHITLDGWAYETRAGTPIMAGAVPEPSTWTMMLCGLGVLAFRRMREAGSPMKSEVKIHLS